MRVRSPLADDAPPQARQAVDAEGPMDVDEPGCRRRCAVLERDRLAGPQADCGREQDHRSVAEYELGGERLELAVGLERALLRSGLERCRGVS